MAMKLIKKSADYKIFVRGDDRYAVQDSNGRSVNGEEKVRILVEEELIKVAVPSAPAAVADEVEAVAEEAAEEPVAEAAEQVESEETRRQRPASGAERSQAERGTCGRRSGGGGEVTRHRHADDKEPADAGFFMKPPSA